MSTPARSAAHHAARLLAQRGKHSHLSDGYDTICISGHCTPVPGNLTTNLLSPADTRPADFTPAGRP